MCVLLCNKGWMQGEQGEKTLIIVVRERAQWERNNQNNENECTQKSTTNMIALEGHE